MRTKVFQSPKTKGVVLCSEWSEYAVEGILPSLCCWTDNTCCFGIMMMAVGGISSVVLSITVDGSNDGGSDYQAWGLILGSN